MTKSQIVSAAATAAVIVNELAAKIDLLSDLLPPKYAHWLRTLITVAGILLAAFSQSLNKSHISAEAEKVAQLPVDTQIALGVRKQVVGK
jgi:TRAP-type C4-dicarboxylate transport system permease small subunit